MNDKLNEIAEKHLAIFRGLGQSITIDSHLKASFLRAMQEWGDIKSDSDNDCLVQGNLLLRHKLQQAEADKQMIKAVETQRMYNAGMEQMESLRHQLEEANADRQMIQAAGYKNAGELLGALEAAKADVERLENRSADPHCWNARQST